jgi:hypothetical protein
MLTSSVSASHPCRQGDNCLGCGRHATFVVACSNERIVHLELKRHYLVVSARQDANRGSCPAR